MSASVDSGLLLHLLVQVDLPCLFQLVSVFYAQRGGFSDSDPRVFNALLPILVVLETLGRRVEQIRQIVRAEVTKHIHFADFEDFAGHSCHCCVLNGLARLEEEDLFTDPIFGRADAQLIRLGLFGRQAVFRLLNVDKFWRLFRLGRRICAIGRLLEQLDLTIYDKICPVQRFSFLYQRHTCTVLLQFEALDHLVASFLRFVLVVG